MKSLVNLLISNKARGSFKASADTNTIELYDVIVSSDDEAQYYGGISLQAFSRALGTMAGDVQLRIKAETWFTPQEAKDVGLCDEVAPGPATALARATGTLWDLSVFDRAPKSSAMDADAEADRQRRIHALKLRGGSPAAALEADAEAERQQRIRTLQLRVVR